MSDHVAARVLSSRHRQELLASPTCVCVLCLRTFPPSAIVQRVDDDPTAICPHCGIDSVIGFASGYPINAGFLERMHSHWFTA